MAFRSNGPITLSLPAFRGMTRRIILLALTGFFVLAVLGLVSAGLANTLEGLLALIPAAALHLQLWQFLTYPFVDRSLLGTAFALLSVWFFASTLEDELGSRWLGEFFLLTTVGGGLAACLLTFASDGHVLGLDRLSVASGLWPFVLALMIAFARFHAEEEVRFNFLFQIKARYLAVIYVLVYLAWALLGGDRFAAVLALCNAAVGYGFLRLAPRRGLRSAASEGWFGLRNAFYRNKRRRAAKKFAVYMRKQGKDVSLDEQGRYVEPDAERRGSRDPNDKRWRN